MSDEVVKHLDIDGVSQQLGPGDRPIAALADSQHGVVAYRQLLAAGYSRGAIEHRIAAGRLHRLYKGVYAVGRRRLTPQGHWMSVVLACGPRALISHRTAAALWNLRPTGQTVIDVTVPGPRYSRPSIRVHRTSVLRADDIATKHGIPVTSVARTLIDLGVALDRDQLLRATEQAERLGLFDLHAVERALQLNPRRPGSAQLRAALADYHQPADTRSELERRFWVLIRGIDPAPQINVLVAGLEVDFFWPRSRLVVELDSRAYHTSPRAFERDRTRDATLLRAGCRVLRVTFKRLASDPAKVLEDVLALTNPNG